MHSQHTKIFKNNQQGHTPDSFFCCSFPVAIFITGFMMFSLQKMTLTSLQIARKASSTPSPVRALTSLNITGMFGEENLSAKAIPSSVETARLAWRSNLFANIILGTPGGAFSFIWLIQVLKFSKESRSVIEYANTIPDAPLQYVSVMVRYLYWPAVSQICNLTFFPSISKVRALKSTPIVATQLYLKRSPTKERMRFVLPTPLSPIIISLARISTLSFAFIIIFYLNCQTQLQEGIVIK